MTLIISGCLVLLLILSRGWWTRVIIICCIIRWGGLTRHLREFCFLLLCFSIGIKIDVSNVYCISSASRVYCLRVRVLLLLLCGCSWISLLRRLSEQLLKERTISRIARTHSLRSSWHTICMLKGSIDITTTTFRSLVSTCGSSCSLPTGSILQGRRALSLHLGARRCFWSICSRVIGGTSWIKYLWGSLLQISSRIDFTTRSSCLLFTGFTCSSFFSHSMRHMCFFKIR